MPGTNAGTGQPLTLRCGKCRRWRGGHREGTNLEATGKLRPAEHRGVRQTNRLIQYRCKDCGHVGWSQHIDAERLYQRYLAATRDR